MFSGSVDSISHEGGLLLTFDGSSPALDSIIIRSSDGVYIGKIDGVLGNTDSPMAHVGHIDRKLDLNSLIGEEVTIRAKKPREERYPSRDRRDGGGRRDFDRGSRDRRDGGKTFTHNDWDCPKCNNSNFSFRKECNRCGEPRPGGGGGNRDSGGRNFDRGSRDRRDGGGRRDFNRSSRGRDNFQDGDWYCPKCNNSNFARRTECNRCGEPRSGGGGRRERGRGNFDRGTRDRRDGGGRRDFDRGTRDRRDGGGRTDRREFSNRDDNRGKPKENNFRKSKGKRPGHAHNNAPKPIVPRKFRRNSDD